MNYFKHILLGHADIKEPILQYFDKYFQITMLQKVQDYLLAWDQSRLNLEKVYLFTIDNIDNIIDDYKLGYHGISILIEFIEQRGNQISPSIKFVYSTTCLSKIKKIETQDLQYECICYNYNLAIIYIIKVIGLIKIDFMVVLNKEISQKLDEIINGLVSALFHIENAINLQPYIEEELKIDMNCSYLESIRSYIYANKLKILLFKNQNQLSKQQLVAQHLNIYQNYNDSFDNMIRIKDQKNSDILEFQIEQELLGRFHLQQACYYQALIYDPKSSITNKTQGLMGQALALLNKANELSKLINFTVLSSEKQFIEHWRQFNIQIDKTLEDYTRRNQQIYKDQVVDFGTSLFIQSDSQNSKQLQEISQAKEENIFILYVQQRISPPIKPLQVKSSIIGFDSKIMDTQKVKQAFLISEMDKNLRLSVLAMKNEEDQVFEQEINNNDIRCSIFVNQMTNLDQIEEITNLGPKQNIQMETQRLLNSHLTDKCQLEEDISIQLKSMSGILLKKSPHILQGFQRRYCELKNKIFKYYRMKDRVKPYGIINFELQSYQITSQKDKKGQIKQFIIRPEFSQKLFIFKGPSAKNNEDWVTAILENYQQSRGFQTIMTSLTQYHRFWRNDIVSPKQFESEAKTGDIILFRGKDVNCQLQRACTGAEFDHVGLVLKYDKAIYVFEATGSFGVGLCSWNSIMSNQWYQLFDKIVYRKLHHERGYEFTTKLQSFVQDNIGKKFSCSLKKLMQKKSTILLQENKDPSLDKIKARTFFCSELVAKTYKTLGILPEVPASSTYWPNSFTSNFKPPLQLLDGARLSGEFLINFI